VNVVVEFFVRLPFTLFNQACEQLVIYRAVTGWIH
jgi:hypothetical protein